MVDKIKFNFRRCVPKEVRDHADDLINGSANAGNWLAESFAWIDVQSARIKQEFADERRDAGMASWLCQQERKLLAFRAELVEAIDCMKRLVGDSRMDQAYKLLNQANLAASDQARFIHAAWIAHYDYGRVRDEIKRQEKLAKQIAPTAEKLARLLRELMRLPRRTT